LSGLKEFGSGGCKIYARVVYIDRRYGVSLDCETVPLLIQRHSL
jgi:hypothetical protein